MMPIWIRSVRLNDKVSSIGAFKVYQAKNGGIYLLMGTKVTALLKSQLMDLGIDHNLYEMIDFNQGAYNVYYAINPK